MTGRILVVVHSALTSNVYFLVALGIFVPDHSADTTNGFYVYNRTAILSAIYALGYVIGCLCLVWHCFLSV